MNSRQKGTRNEQRSIAILEAAGYYCVRSHLSQGMFDIVGISTTDVVLVQVSTRDWKNGAQLEALQQFVCPANARKLMHRYRDRVALPDVKEVT